jgi:hypothetical protein
MAYAATCCPEGIGYAMSRSPVGPWKFKGMIMDGTPKSNGNHPGIIDYKGKSYVFGLNYDLLKQSMTKHYERRSVSAAEIRYNADGTIQKLPYWSETHLMQVGTLNPYNRVEAETMAFSKGLKTKKVTEWERNIPWNRGKRIATRLYVTSINNDDYIKVQGVDFASGPSLVEVNTASLNGGKIEIRIDGQSGPLLGIINIRSKAEGDVFKTVSQKVQNVKGIHDLYFVFKGSNDLFEFDWWKFVK